jgi:filamentous hemagglutinin
VRADTGGVLVQTGNAAPSWSFSGAFDNTNGTLSIGATDWTFAPSSLINDGGQLLHTGSGTFTLTTGAIANAGGTIATNGDLALQAASLDNTGGTVSAVGSASITTPGAITNSGGTIVVTNGSLDNTSGHVYATGTLTYDDPLSALTNTNGFLGAHGDVNLSLASLSNSGGTIGSDNNLTISGTTGMVGAGTLSAGNSLALSLNGDLTISGQNGVSAGNALTLDLTGNLTNLGTFSAPGTLTLDAANITNSGTLESSSSLALTASGAITNSGTMQSSTVTTSSASLANTGSILGDNVSITASGTVANVGSGPSTVSSTSSTSSINYFVQAQQLLAAITNVWGQDLTSGLTNNQFALDVESDLANYPAFAASNTNSVANDPSLVGGATPNGGWTPAEFSVMTQWMDIFNPNFFEQQNSLLSTYIGTSYSEGIGAVQLYAAESQAGLPTSEVANLYAIPQQYIQKGGNPTTTAQNIYNAIAALGTWSSADLAALQTGLQNCITYGLPNGLDQVSDIVDIWVGYMNTALAQSYLSAWSPASSTVSAPAVNQNAGTIAATTSTTITAGTLNNTNAALIYSGGTMTLTAPTMLNSSSTIQAQGDLSLAAATSLTNEITAYSSGSGLVSLSENTKSATPITTIETGSYLTGSTGAASILSGGDMNLTIGTLTNGSTIAAGGNLVQHIGSYNELYDTSLTTLAWNAADSAADTTTTAPFNTNVGPVLTGQLSLTGTIGSIQPVVVGSTATGADGNSTSVSSSGSAAGAGVTTVSGVGATGAGPSSVSRATGTGATSAGGAAGAGITSVAGTAVRAPSAADAGGTTVTSTPSSATPVTSRTSEVVASASTSSPSGLGTQVVARSGSETGTTVAAPAAQTAAAAGSAAQAVAGTPNLHLPTSGIYRINTTGNTLVTTIGPFASNGPSSAEIISADDPGYTGKVLGDSFYEQQLVQEQVTQLTGMEYLPGYSSTESEYAALLSNGVQSAQAFNLQVGQALSATQMAELTSNIVWLVNEVVDGQTVLVPVVYLASVSSNDLKPNGALIESQTITLQTGNLDNVGTIRSSDRTQIVSSGNVTNSGLITSQGNTVLVASGNITDTAGTISAGNDLGLQAGGNITVNPTISSPGTVAIGFAAPQTITGQGTLSAGGTMTVLSAGNINLIAANVQAGGNLTLQGANVTASDAKNIAYVSLDSPRATGSSYNEQVLQTSINAGGNVNIAATAGDVNLQATNVTAGGALNVGATGNVAITSATQTNDRTYTDTINTSGFLSSTSTTTSMTNDSTSVIGSTLSGNTVTIAAGQNLSVTGSNIVSTGDVSLAAGNSLSVTSAQSTSYQASSVSTTTSGLMGASSGIGFSIGTSKQSNASTDSSTTQVASNIGSLTGNLSLSAGAANTITGSSLYALQNLSVTGSTVNIGSSFNTDTFTQTSSSSFTGFSASISSPAIAAGEGAVASIQQAGSVQNAQLQDLLAIQAGTDVATASQALTAKNGGILAGGQVSLSFGTSSESSSSTTTTNTAVGSTLTGSDVAVIATGGDLDVTGSTISGTNIALQAAQNINLTAAQNTSTTQTTNSASSTSIGVSLAVGQQASAPSSNPKLNMGLPSFNFSTATSNSNSTGTSVHQVNTVVNGTGAVSLTSGGNTTLSGAQVSGNSILANISGNLDLTSLQDTSTYNANSSSAGLNLSYSGNVLSGSINTSSGKTNSNYASVIDQTGLFAGAGGFDITVAGNTNLTGAVIASTAAPSLNSLTIGTLTFGNIQNSANYSASTSGFSASLGGPGLPFMPSGLSSLSTSGSASSTTLAAISPGLVSVLSGGASGASLAGISRDPGTAANALAPIFNQMQVSQTLEAGQLFGQIATEAAGQLADRLSKTNILGQPTVGAWAEGGADRTALHGIIGAITAAIVGGNPLSGAAGSMVGEEADAFVQNAILKATSNLPPAEAKLVSNIALNIIAGAAGSAVGSAVGGSGGASIGGSTALTGDLYNRQLNSAEKARIKGMIAAANAAGDIGAATRYADEACFKDQCYAQIPQSDTNAYQSALNMYNAGAQLAAANSPQYQSDIQQLTAGGLFTYSNQNIVEDQLSANNPNSGVAARQASGAASPLCATCTGLELGNFSYGVAGSGSATDWVNGELAGLQSEGLSTPQLSALVNNAVTNGGSNPYAYLTSELNAACNMGTNCAGGLSSYSYSTQAVAAAQALLGSPQNAAPSLPNSLYEQIAGLTGSNGSPLFPAADPDTSTIFSNAANAANIFGIAGAGSITAPAAIELAAAGAVAASAAAPSLALSAYLISEGPSNQVLSPELEAVDGQIPGSIGSLVPSFAAATQTATNQAAFYSAVPSETAAQIAQSQGLETLETTLKPAFAICACISTACSTRICYN